ncbi:uncharacterized protein A4U43_C10F17830 [Asparagus officinalis]|uniref:Uncharacterized protein n=1 Tax=Asparagus officinalis TaxID=4686 RepID=A0A5P1E423_ASPOF|nr:uncharacterized protein A4U43_C10F17830 [Asparagus officinalis]
MEEEVIYTIDVAKKMKHEELIPIESRNRGGARDRVKEKADRHCKRIWLIKSDGRNAGEARCRHGVAAQGADEGWSSIGCLGAVVTDE